MLETVGWLFGIWVRLVTKEAGDDFSLRLVTQSVGRSVSRSVSQSLSSTDWLRGKSAHDDEDDDDIKANQTTESILLLF